MLRIKKLPVRDLCLIGIFSAMICVLAQLGIPMPYGVPMTLQTFAISLTGIVLGAQKGALAALVYVLLGAVGVPVFVGFTGGLGIVLGPTGGFILSFPILALTAGIGAGKNGKLWLYAGLVTGVVINYLCGILVYCLVLSGDWQAALAVCVLPFIPTDCIKIVLAAVLGERMKAVLAKGRVPV